MLLGLTLWVLLAACITPYIFVLKHCSYANPRLAAISSCIAHIKKVANTMKFKKKNDGRILAVWH